jgi:hypothetical protein
MTGPIAISQICFLLLAPFFPWAGAAATQATFLQDALPQAQWLGEGDLYEEPVLGRFRTNPVQFPFIESDILGPAFAFRDAQQGVYMLYAMAGGCTDCAAPLGWIYTTADSAPLYYSLRHAAWAFIPERSRGEAGLWLFDYASGDWFTYR